MSGRLSSEDLEEIEGLYDQGKMVQAYRLGIARGGPGAGWQGPQAHVMWGRLLNNLGASRRGSAVHIRAARSWPDHPWVQGFMVYSLLQVRGPWAAWTYCRSAPAPNNPRVKDQVNWLAAQAAVLAVFRDFVPATDYLEEAATLDPLDPWVKVERARLLSLQDHHEEALHGCEEIFSLRPGYRSAVHLATESMIALGRDADALQLLELESQRQESPHLWAQLAQCHLNQEQPDAAHEAWLKANALALEADKGWKQAVEAQLAISWYRKGNRDEALAAAEKIETPYHRSIVQNLKAAPADAEIIQLPVDYIRQQHLTCAPATMAILTRFLGKPAAHLEISEAVCYDGTPGHKSRKWAEDHGWVVREFTLDETTALRLLRAGLPFALTTVEPGNAHMQAVIGIDLAKRVFLIRDPYFRHIREFLIDETLEKYESVGPLCQVLIPLERQEEFASREFPDAEAYDLLYAMQWALESHQREEAQGHLDILNQDFPEHRISLLAAWHVASYDQDVPAQLNAARTLHQMFPKDVTFLRATAGLMQGLVPYGERLECLEKAASEPEAHCLVLSQLADLLSEDQRHRKREQSLRRRALRVWPVSPEFLAGFQSMAWESRNHEQALQLSRFISCLDIYNDYRADRYFSMARFLGRSEEALNLLRHRVETLGSKSGRPAMSLAQAYEAMSLAHEAQEVLREARRQRPEDGELALAAADLFGRTGFLEEAHAHLAAAEGRARREEVLRQEAWIATYENRPAHARQCWEKILERSPLHMEAHQSLARILDETESTQAAREHLRHWSSTYPYHVGLLSAYVGWLDETRDEDALAALNRFLELHPGNAWAWREVAWRSARSGALKEGRSALGQVLAIDPDSASSLAIQGFVLRAEGDYPGAMKSYEQALTLDVDDISSAHALLELCHTSRETREALEKIRQETVRQSTSGAALLEYAGLAGGVMDPETIEQHLRSGFEARPDLWESHSALGRYLTQRERFEEALRIMDGACARFPLLPVVWADRAHIHRYREDASAEIADLEQALTINPQWTQSLIRLAEAWTRCGKIEAAFDVVSRALAYHPNDAQLHCLHGDLLAHEEDLTAAMEAYTRSVTFAPAYRYAWDRLRSCAAALHRLEDVKGIAREVARTRAGNYQAWLILASLLDSWQESSEALAAHDHAIAAAPHNPEVYDAKAQYLAETHRLEEAITFCRSVRINKRQPLILMGREAWLLHQRGDRSDAIRIMEKAVRRSPAYSFGLRQLAEWYEEDNQVEDSLRVCRQLVEAAPLDAVHWGFLGHSQRLLKKPEDALESFARAVSLDPEYLYAIRAHLELLVEVRTLKAARAWLHGVTGRIPPRFALLCQLRLCMRSNPFWRWGWKKPMEGLLQAPGLEMVEFQEAVHLVQPSPFLSSRLRSISYRAMRDGYCRLPAVGRHWAEKTLASLPVFLLKVRKIPADNPASEEAVMAAIELLGRNHAGWRLRLLHRIFQERIRNSGPLTVALAYGWHCALLDKKVIQMLADWRDRPDLEPWILTYLGGSHLNCGQTAAAREVFDAALAMPPDIRRANLYYWSASCAVAEMDWQRFYDDFIQIEKERLDEYYHPGWELMSAVLGDPPVVPGRRLPGREMMQRLRQTYVQVNSQSNNRSFTRLYDRLKTLVKNTPPGR